MINYHGYGRPIKLGSNIPGVPPIAVNDSYTPTYNDFGPYVINVLTNDTINSANAFTLVSGGNYVNVPVLNLGAGTITYTPHSSEYNSAVIIVYKLSNVYGSSTASLTINVPQEIIPGQITAVDDSIAIDPMVETTLDVLANDSYDVIQNIAVVSKSDNRIYADFNLSNELVLKAPYSLSGDQIDIQYLINNGSASDIGNVVVDINYTDPPKPWLGVANVEEPSVFALMQNNGLPNFVGAQSYQGWVFAGTDWFDAAGEAGVTTQLSFLIGREETGFANNEDQLLSWNDGAIGFSPSGEDAFQILADNPYIHPLINHITLEFEGSIATSSTNQAIMQWARDSFAFLKAQLDSIGLTNKLYGYRVENTFFPGDVNNPAGKIQPWSRPVYLMATDNSTEKSIQYGRGSFGWQEVDGAKDNFNISSGVYVQAFRRDPINPRGAWSKNDGPGRYIDPGSEHLMNFLYNAQFIEVDWITMFSIRSGIQVIGPMGPQGPAIITYPWQRDSYVWQSNLEAINRWYYDDIPDNYNRPESKFPIKAI